MEYTPCGHRVLVQPDKLFNIDKTFKKAMEAGIAIPEIEELKREEAAIESGTVLAIGNTAYKDFGGDPWCAVGDRIYFARYAGKRLPDPEAPSDTTKWVLLLNDEDVCVIVKETN